MVDYREPPCSASRRPGVLVALADAQERSEVAKYLTRQDFNVWTAETGVEAITTYLEHNGSVDFLFLDAELADLPGLSFLRRFKTHFPGVPCIFRAGRSDAVVARLRAEGATILPLSLDPAALAEHLWDLVAFEFLVEV